MARIKRELSGLIEESWECTAKEVIYLKLVRSEADLDDSSTTFSPVYTHQLFDEEKIRGYRGLKIEIFFLATDLYTYFNYSYDLRHESNFDDVEKIIASKMAPGYTKHIGQFIKHLRKHEFTPMGSLVQSYSLPEFLSEPVTKESIFYDIYHCNFATPGLRDYHQRLQFFLLFYIESSSYIDSLDPIWQLLLLFERRESSSSSSSAAISTASSSSSSSTRHLIVGYTTLYRFFCFPDAFRLRLSQILVLPPFQRRAHGRRLVQQVYHQAHASAEYIEITVEDPSPGFQRLRDSLDLQLCMEHAFFPQIGGLRKKRAKFALSLSPSLMREIKIKLKLTESQITRCYETFRLAFVDKDDEEEYRAFRLEVKARLNNLHREELSVQNYDAHERKRRLHEMYEELEAEYEKLIQSLQE